VRVLIVAVLDESDGIKLDDLPKFVVAMLWQQLDQFKAANDFRFSKQPIFYLGKQDGDLSNCTFCAKLDTLDISERIMSRTLQRFE
jgi:hypothetical protein